jgi:hypothetical protein
LAEVARQVGRRGPVRGRPAVRGPRYEAAVRLTGAGEVVFVDSSRLLEY